VPPNPYQVPPQPPVWQQPYYPAAPLHQAPSRSGSSWLIVVGILLAVFLGMVVGGRVLLHRIRERMPPAASTPPGVPIPPDVTSAPQTFPLNKGATVTIKSINGPVTVEGWDETQAEVRVSGDSRAQSAMTSRHDPNSLLLEAPSSGTLGFSVKVPHDLGTVTISTTNGPIKLTGVSGKISIDGMQGTVTLTDVAGVERVKTINGPITATLTGNAKDHSMQFETVNGPIRLTVPADFGATLDAETTHGGIDLDQAFEGVKIDKGFIGSHASGPIGPGGPSLNVKTVNGSIRIGK
jgi:hypothetical protein